MVEYPFAFSLLKLVELSILSENSFFRVKIEESPKVISLNRDININAITMHDYHISMLTSMSEVKQLRSFWRSVACHPAADYDFFNLILKRTNVVSPCVFVVSHQEKIVALLAGRNENGKVPIRIGYASLLEINVRKLVLIEGGFMGDKSPEIWTYLLSFIQDLLLNGSLDLVSLEHLVYQSPNYVMAVRVFGKSRICLENKASEHWLLRLPNTWEEFMSIRSKKRRYWLNRLPKVLERDFPKLWSIACYGSREDALKFIDSAEIVASKTYHRSLGVGFRKDEETLSRITAEAELGHFWGYVLYINELPTSFWYCFADKETLYLVATGYDPKYQSYEVGTVLLLKVFQDQINHKGKLIDFGLGDAGYKQRFATEYFLEGSLFVFPRTFKGLLMRNFYIAGTLSNELIKHLLDSFGLTQRIKTMWRRKKSGDSNMSADHSKWSKF